MFIEQAMMLATTIIPTVSHLLSHNESDGAGRKDVNVPLNVHIRKGNPQNLQMLDKIILSQIINQIDHLVI